MRGLVCGEHVQVVRWLALNRIIRKMFIHKFFIFPTFIFALKTGVLIYYSN